MPKTVSIRILRQDRPGSQPYSQRFELPYQPGMNVISCLQDIAVRPVTADGQSTTPPVYESNCLENVCGSCTMVINGRVRQACNTLVDPLLKKSPEIDLRPMTKFPVLRDLIVDRRRMFEALKKVRAWVPVDSYGFLGEGPQQGPQQAERRYELSRCMTCGCCLDACPQINPRSAFIGPQAIGQAMLFNEHPTGQMTADERLAALMGLGGITDCGNSQNCVKVCPKEVPLTWAIGKAGRETTKLALRRFFQQ